MLLTVWSSALQGWFETEAALWYARLPVVQLHLAAQGHQSFQGLMPLCRTGAIHSAWCQHPRGSDGMYVPGGNSYREVLIVLLGSSMFSLDWKTCSV